MKLDKARSLLSLAISFAAVRLSFWSFYDCLKHANVVGRKYPVSSSFLSLFVRFDAKTTGYGIKNRLNPQKFTIKNCGQDGNIFSNNFLLLFVRISLSMGLHKCMNYVYMGCMYLNSYKCTSNNAAHKLRIGTFCN